MSNPYESPKTPVEPNGPPGMTGRAAGSFVLGAFVCGAVTLLGAMIAAVIAGVLINDPYGASFLVVFLNAPAVLGPLSGVGLWALVRKRNRAFAVGAVAFGVAAFLLVGGCFALMWSG
ncbi:MAG: hypothetical protein ACYC6Y_28410 [Thermoguttaceae bacterium]